MNGTAQTRSGADAGGIDHGIPPEGHRLPAATRLGPVRLQVSDLKRSLEYYERVLGLRAVGHDHGGITLASHGEDRTLVRLEERGGAAPVPREGHIGLYHFALLLPTRSDLGRFLQHLSQLEEPAGASDHLVSEALYLRDPDGLGIEVYADRPRSAWETHGREIRMATAPMNRRAVLASAGDAIWSGMPPGTRIGHVHLHVRDLEEARAFYHDGLGLDKMVWSYPGALFLSAGGYHHHLGLNVWVADASPAGEDDAKLLEWTVELPQATDVLVVVENLKGAGYQVERPSKGEIRTWDPWGTQMRVRVAADAERGG